MTDILPALLDFSQPFNVTLLETTITTFYQSHNAEQVRGSEPRKEIKRLQQAIPLYPGRSSTAANWYC
jgi:hypothetical protein